MLHQNQSEIDERFMSAAIEEAIDAYQKGEIPIGAVIVVNNRIIARGHNLTEALKDVTAHAEMQAITAAANNLGGKYLTQCTLYVTVEPCAMCAGALGWAQIKRIVYGAADPKRGYRTFFPQSKTPFHPKTIIEGGVLADECGQLMTDFFRQLR